jgi:hypothetical protein
MEGGGSFQGTFPATAERAWNRSRENLNSASRNPSVIRTDNLSTISTERYRYTFVFIMLLF